MMTNSEARETKLSIDEVLMLRDLKAGPLGPTAVNTGRPFVQVCEGLVSLGLAKAHRSSIGELSEKATYSISTPGIACLDRLDRCT